MPSQLQGLERIAKRVPVVRTLLSDTPDYWMGSVVENRAGLQVGRALVRHGLLAVRRKPTFDYDPEYLRTIERDGILLIRDFLPAEQFERVSSEFERVRETMELRPYYGTGDDFTIRVAFHNLHRQPELTPCTMRYLAENRFIRQVAGHVIRRCVEKRTIEPVRYQVLDRVERDVDDDDASRLHADIHFPTVKVFYYLGPVDEKNAPFHYAVGSHRLTLGRLVHEYNMSIRAALIRAGREGRVCESGKTVRGQHVRALITEEEMSRIGIREEPFVGVANTLVIANTMGFHRRGHFAVAGVRRETLNISFRKRQSSPARRLVYLKDLGKRPAVDIARAILDR
jgi:hypothetical protein